MNNELADSIARLTPQQRQALAMQMHKKRSAAAPVNPLQGLRLPNEPLPLSFAQERLWFVEALGLVGSAYHMGLPLHLRGELDEAALAWSFAELVRRHESLRTRFETVNGQPVQMVGGAADFAIQRLCVEDVQCREGETLLQGFARQELHRPFDLARGPLFRVSLLPIGAQEHALVMVMHHIVSDGWSNGIIVRELNSLYASFCRSEPSQLAELPVQYADYALWQRKSFEGSALARQLGYWKTQLADAPGVLELPTDRPRPAVPSYRGGLCPFELPKALSETLAQLAKQQGVTLFMLLLAAFQVVLSRWSGQDDIVVGTPTAGRTHRQTEDLIGLFVNTLALRTRIKGGDRFVDLLAQVKEVVLSAFVNQDLPFERLVNELAPERDLSRQPIFQAMMVLQNVSVGRLQLGELQLETIPLEQASAKFDLTLAMCETADGLCGAFEYATDLFDAPTIERFAGHFTHFLEQVAGAPTQVLPLLGSMPPAERRQVLSYANATGSGPMQAQCLHERFEAQVAHTPDAVAIAYLDQRLSYRQLNEQANRLAHHLIGLGVQPDDRVAICMERSPAMVMGMLAILKAGGAYVPMDPSYPEDRLRHMLSDSAPVALLTQASLREGMSALCLRAVVVIDDGSHPDGVAIASQPAINPDACGVGAHHLANVIYTSGSTGMPKGVLVEHRNVFGLVVDNHYAPVAVGDCVAHCANPAFDASTWEIWSALLNGARLLVVPQAVLLDPMAFGDALLAGGVTALFLTVGLFNEYAQVLQAVFGGLRYLLVGGDALDPRTITRLLASGHAPQHLVNCYGPTETTTYASTFEIRSLAADARSVPIGCPIAHTQTYVLDRDGQPAPVGVIGEIHIGGAGVARGYLNRPDLTTERFIADTFSQAPDARLYKTGDLGRWLPDGMLDHMGRNDFQVKIRGFRVELGEIEAALYAHAAVRQATVAVRRDEGGPKRLVAYVVPHASDDTLAATLRKQLEGHLPEYMIPAAIVMLDKLPLTPNGKVDRNALPAPTFTVRDRLAPRTPLEAKVHDLFAEVLKLDALGVDVSFFELGGDSITSIQLVSRARKAGLLITPRDIFRHQTVEALALAARVADDQPAATEHRDGPLPMTPIISWWLAQGEPTGRFSQARLLQAPAGLSESTLLAALQALLDHHDALRLRLRRGDAPAAWQMDTVAHGSLRAQDCLRIVDMRGLDSATLQATIARELFAAQARLDPFAGKQLQAVWFDAGHGTPGRLLLVLHHMVVDGVSWRILAADLAGACAAAQAGRQAALEPVATSFYRWAHVLDDDARSAKRIAEAAVWQAMLDGTDPLLSARRLDPQIDTYRHAASLSLSLPAEIAEPLLTRIPALFHGRVNDVLLSTFTLALAHWRRLRLGTAGCDVYLDLEGHGREDIYDNVDLSRTVGWFTSLFPVRLDPGSIDLDGAMAGGRDLAHAVKRIKEQLRALPDNGLGYGLLRHLNLETGAALAAFATPQIAFNYLGRFAVTSSAASDGDWAAAPESGGLIGGKDLDSAMAHAIELNAITEDHEDGPRFVASWAWATQLFDEAAIRDLAHTWFTALRALVVLTAQADVGGFTPSDLSGLSLSQAQIDRIEATQPAVAEMLPVSPGQAALLFVLPSAGQAGGDVRSHRWIDLAGSLDAAALRTALGELLRRHPNLGARFVVDGLPAPVQIIPRDVVAPWQFVDLSHLDDEQRAKALHQVLDEMHGQPVDLAGASLLQFALVRLGAAYHRIVLTYHPLLLDAWSVPVLIQELFALYHLPDGGRALPPVASFRHYLSAVQEGQADAVAAWQGYLAGLPAAMRLASDTATAGEGLATHERALSPGLTASLLHHARDARLTLDTLVQAAWGVVLGQASRQDDLAFGVAVAGRSPRLSGVESMVGMLANVVPLRIQLGDKTSTVHDWLHRIQQQQCALLAHQPVSPDAMLAQAGWPVGFESEVVVERDIGHVGIDGDLDIVYIHQHDAPQPRRALRLSAIPGTALTLRLCYRTDFFTPATIGELADSLHAVLRSFARGLHVPLSVLDADDDGAPQTEAGVPVPVRAEFSAPRSDRERTLAQIWSAVLQAGPVGVDDDFFALGGDMQAAVRIAARATAAGLAVSPGELFEAGTVAALAARLERATADRRVVPLTPVQRIFLALWGDELWLNASSYLFRFDRAIGGATVRQALLELLARHDAFRLTVTQEGGRWVQRLAHAPIDADALCPVIDLSGLDAAAAQQRIGDEVQQLGQGVRLDSGCLMGARLFTFGPAQPVQLAMHIHHFATDTLSYAVMVEELQALCQRGLQSGAATLPPVQTSFARWATMLAEQFATRSAQADVERLMASVQPMRLPLDHPDGLNVVGSSRSVAVTLAEFGAGVLTPLAQRFELAAEDLLLAALAQAIRRWSGETRVTVEQINNGRVSLGLDCDVSRTLGWYSTGIPITFDLAGDDDLAALARQIHQSGDRADMGGLLYWAETARRLDAGLPWSTNPVSLNHQGERHMSAAVQGDAPVQRIGLPPMAAPAAPSARRIHVIELQTAFSHEGLHCLWRYSGNLHVEATMHTLSRHLHSVLTLFLHSGAAAHPPGPAGRIHASPAL